VWDNKAGLARSPTVIKEVTLMRRTYDMVIGGEVSGKGIEFL